MKMDLLNIKLPQEYKENLFQYKEGLDNVPNWIELKKKGYTWNEHLKLDKLIEIENMKYRLNEAINNNEVSDEEIQEAEYLIKNTIKEYNDI